MQKGMLKVAATRWVWHIAWLKYTGRLVEGRWDYDEKASKAKEVAYTGGRKAWLEVESSAEQRQQAEQEDSSSHRSPSTHTMPSSLHRFCPPAFFQTSPEARRGRKPGKSQRKLLIEKPKVPKRLFEPPPGVWGSGGKCGVKISLLLSFWETNN